MDPKDFGKAYELFRKRMYYKDKHGEISISCKISAALNSPETHHNCIGCNLLVSLDTIERVLRRLSEAKELESEADYPAFILPLYLFVERAHMVFGMIELPKSYEAKYFGVFTTIKRWANFLKHPNYFILAHHPKFEVGTKPSKKSKTLVNTDFVRTH